jgi:hypothetical protein
LGGVKRDFEVLRGFGRGGWVKKETKSIECIVEIFLVRYKLSKKQVVAR